MVHDQVHIPLGEKFKAGSFWKDHPKHCVCLFNPTFLTAAHGIAVINTGPLDPIYTGLQRVRVTEFRAAVCEDIFKH